MGDFWAESIRLVSLATERFLCLLGQDKSRLIRPENETFSKTTLCRGGGVQNINCTYPPEQCITIICEICEKSQILCQHAAGRPLIDLSNLQKTLQNCLN